MHAPTSTPHSTKRASRWGLWTALGLMVALAALTHAPEAEAIGLLIPNEPSLPPLAIKSHRVKIDMTDQAAVTRVEQVFVNHTGRQLEATFIFALPPGSTVSDFALWINGVKTKGTVLEKDKARSIYEGIVRRTEDPGLVEYMDGTLFQARIYPVPANGEQKVEIAYASVMDQTGNMRRFLYPLKTGRSAARLLKDFTMVANISSKAPLKAIYSPTHKIHVARKDDHHATVSFEKDAVDLEEDFMMYMATGGDDVGLSLLTYDKDGPGGEDGYYLMVLAPRVDIDESEVPAKTVTFVVDTSGSMIGDKMTQARESLKYCIQKLRPNDTFNVIRFSTDVEALFGKPMPATKDRVRAGVRFADDLEAAGGTAIDDALTEALRAHTPPGQPHLVLFMTDGRPTVGNTEIPEIINNAKKNNTKGARLFTFGVGYDVNTTLLDRVAGEGGGGADYIRPSEDIEVKVGALYNKIAYPVMSNLNVDYGAHSVYDTYPRAMPDLFRDGQVIVMGRFKKTLPSTMKLSGNVAGRGVTFVFDETGPSPGAAATAAHDFIPKLWATRKVGYLLSELRAQGEIKELKDEVIRLARRYGLVTPYTSYLAVDDSELERRPPPPAPRFGRRGGLDGELDDISGGERSKRDARRRPAGKRQTARKSPPRAQDAPMAAPAEIAVEESENLEGDRFYGNGGGAAAGRGKGGGGSYHAPAPRVVAKARKKKEREKALAGKKGFEAKVGKDAVESSIATKSLADATTTGAASSLRTRHLDDRLYVYKNGTWHQDGLDTKKAIKIKYLSNAYFNLLKAHPQLGKSFALGGSIALQVGKKTVIIGQTGQTELSTDKIRAW